MNAAVESIMDVLAPGNLVILESTSPIGTTEGIAKRITECRPDLHIDTNGKDDARKAVRALVKEGGVEHVANPAELADLRTMLTDPSFLATSSVFYTVSGRRS